MANLEERRSPTKLAKRLLRYLPEQNDTKFSQASNAAKDNDEVFERLRIQSDQFASIYPLFESADLALRRRLLAMLYRCARSSVSANLLAKEKRVWEFLVAVFDDELDDLGRIIFDDSEGCIAWHSLLFFSVLFLKRRIR